MSDETSDFINASFNKLEDRITGYAYHGGYFNMPIFTEMDTNLWTGGTPAGRPSLTKHFDKVLCLYPWEPYPVSDTVEKVDVELYDALDQALEQIEPLADLVNQWRDEGKRVLVHCQAGLNRSSLVAALAIMKKSGKPGYQVINEMRQKRSSEVLCNDAFQEFLLNWGKDG